MRDETELVRESINEVQHSIILAINLVVIVCYMFLGSMRASLVHFFAIPVSLIGKFIFVSLFSFLDKFTSCFSVWSLQWVLL